MTNMTGYNTRRMIRTEKRIKEIENLLKQRGAMYLNDIVEIIAPKMGVSGWTIKLHIQYARRKGRIQYNGKKYFME